MLEGVEVAFDGVASVVVVGVEGGWSAAGLAATFAVPDLI
jgi:hypothetical protein